MGCVWGGGACWAATLELMCPPPAGASASPLKVLCTPEGIRLQCFLKYYTEEMRVNWYHK